MNIPHLSHHGQFFHVPIEQWKESLGGEGDCPQNGSCYWLDYHTSSAEATSWWAFMRHKYCHILCSFGERYHPLLLQMTFSPVFQSCSFHVPDLQASGQLHVCSFLLPKKPAVPRVLPNNFFSQVFFGVIMLQLSTLGSASIMWRTISKLNPSLLFLSQLMRGNMVWGYRCMLGGIVHCIRKRNHILLGNFFI